MTRRNFPRHDPSDLADLNDGELLAEAWRGARAVLLAARKLTAWYRASYRRGLAEDLARSLQRLDRTHAWRDYNMIGIRVYRSGLFNGNPAENAKAWARQVTSLAFARNILRDVVSDAEAHAGTYGGRVLAPTIERIWAVYARWGFVLEEVGQRAIAAESAARLSTLGVEA